jgi:superfamily I DNA and/or RNA helicase
MNSLIMNWSSKAMYNDGLKAHASVRNRTMQDLVSQSSNPASEELLQSPLMLIETAGALMHEGVDEESENESKYNMGEADLVI